MYTSDDYSTFVPHLYMYRAMEALKMHAKRQFFWSVLRRSRGGLVTEIRSLETGALDAEYLATWPHAVFAWSKASGAVDSVSCLGCCMEM